MATSLWPERAARQDTAPELVPAEMFGVNRGRPKATEQAPKDWRKWLLAVFPTYFNRPLAQHHVDFWRHLLSIQLDTPADPDIEVWGRGGGKSTSLEGATVAVGVRGRRRYALYVRETQDQADKSVGNVARMFERSAIERFYPEHARPLLSKFGHSRGWRRNRIRTAGGYTVDAIGLDTASRGMKADDRQIGMILDSVSAAARNSVSAPGVITLEQMTVDMTAHTLILEGDVSGVGPGSMTVLAGFADALTSIESLTVKQTSPFTREQNPDGSFHSPFTITLSFDAP